MSLSGNGMTGIDRIEDLRKLHLELTEEGKDAGRIDDEREAIDALPLLLDVAEAAGRLQAEANWTLTAKVSSNAWVGLGNELADALQAFAAGGADDE